MQYIVLGLQIGFQLVAAYYVFKIMLFETTPTFPYAILFIAFIIRTIILVDSAFLLGSTQFEILLRFLVSMLTMIAFINIYLLIRNKTQ